MSAVPATTVVVIGDSVPFNLDADCPGCTGFVDSYAADLEADLGEPVGVLNRSRHDGARTIHILEQLGSDDGLLAELQAADVIIMSVGFNDQPPFVDQHDGCPEPMSESASLDEAIAHAAASTPDCIDTGVAATRAQIADVFARLREVAPDAPIAALTAYDSWRGWSQLDNLDPAVSDALYAAETYWMQQWNAALCEEAGAVGGVCIDLYTAFNGPDGTEPATEFVAADHTHPSQLGNDAIRDLLLEAALLDR